MDKFPYFDFYRKRFEDLFRRYDDARIKAIGAMLEPECGDIAKVFYRAMLADARAAVYLNHEMVQKRLMDAMTAWLKGLLVPKSGGAVDDYIARQLDVGNFHARINVPISLLNLGVIILKHEISRRLIAYSLDREEVASALVYVDTLIDFSITLITETYFIDVVKFERGAQSLRVQSSNTYLAYECEQVRSSLYDWFRHVLVALHQPHADASSVPDIRQSDFGLWVAHKGKLVFSTKKEIELLEEIVDRLDRGVKKMMGLHARGEWERHAKKVVASSADVTRAGWLIESLAKDVLESESGRDTLTQLFNRRYLPNILAHEIQFNIQQGTRFAVLYVDIDHFKSINDRFGHAQGDAILVELAGLLLHGVRAGDYVFRYGGEEFLVVLTGVGVDRAMDVAEKLRAECESHGFRVMDTERRIATISIGVALTEPGQRDYEKVIARADAALMRAKREGRNRVVLAD